MEEKTYILDEDFTKLMTQMDIIIDKAEEFMESAENIQALSTTLTERYDKKIYFTEEQKIKLLAKSNKLDRIILPFVQEVVNNRG